jgi:hypothetical protein
MGVVVSAFECHTNPVLMAGDIVNPVQRLNEMANPVSELQYEQCY